MAIFVLFLFLLFTVAHSSSTSFFQRCDTDRSYSLSFEEWETCLSSNEVAKTSNSENLFPTNLAELFNLVDVDKDGSISISEYGELQQNLLSNSGADDANEMLEVRLADGSMKKMSRHELSEEMNKRAKGFRKTKNDNIVKEEQNKLNISSLEKENPGLAKMIRMGNSSFEILRKLNYTEGKLARIQTLSDPTIISEENGNLDLEDKLISAHKKSLQSQGLKFYLQLTVELLNKDVELFEIHLEYNSTKYMPPHIAIVQIIKKDAENSDGVKLTIPPLPLRREQAGVGKQGKTLYYSGIIAFFVLNVVAVVFLLFRKNEHEKVK